MSSPPSLQRDRRTGKLTPRHAASPADPASHPRPDRRRNDLGRAVPNGVDHDRVSDRLRPGGTSRLRQRSLRTRTFPSGEHAAHDVDRSARLSPRRPPRSGCACCGETRPTFRGSPRAIQFATSTIPHGEGSTKTASTTAATIATIASRVSPRGGERADVHDGDAVAVPLNLEPPEYPSRQRGWRHVHEAGVPVHRNGKYLGLRFDSPRLTEMKLPLPLLVALIVLCAALVVSTTPASGGVDCRSVRTARRRARARRPAMPAMGGGCTAAVALPFLPFDTQKVCMAPAAGDSRLQEGPEEHERKALPQPAGSHRQALSRLDRLPGRFAEGIGQSVEDARA